ncbi:13391_t:CDS:2 [Funneliformis caledonium]|uniref:13391_t:CDS:1 n=1 Tax=Funneliformis caledonium TaxID=1117310 RepID=A0A9N8ZV89_9GLOM|nr:13391_t:CDS:2 [Funneliformis caledonium]
MDLYFLVGSIKNAELNFSIVEFCNDLTITCGTYRDFSFLLNSTTTWYLADGITSPKLVHAITVVSLSPNGIATKDFQEYEKRHPIEYYMGPWKLEEILSCQQRVFPLVPKDIVINLYYKAGGIPRYVLQNVEQSNYPQMARRYTLRISLQMDVLEKIQEKLEETSWVDCLHKYDICGILIWQVLEDFCLSVMLYTYFPKVGHINIVSDLLKYPEENTVIVPDKQNFGAADLFVTPRSILQVTLQLYFAVSDEIYDKFKHQQYTTRDKDSQKDLPVKTKNSTLRNVEQWALKVQINPILEDRE